MEDMGRRLPALVRRYGHPVLLTAMAEHIAQALQTLQRRRVCDAQAAQGLLNRIERHALQQSHKPRG